MDAATSVARAVCVVDVCRRAMIAALSPNSFHFIVEALGTAVASLQQEEKERTMTETEFITDLSTDRMERMPYERGASRETSVWYMGSLVTFLAEGRDTAGTFALMEVVARAGNEPPPHLHEREDEMLYVLEGRIDAWVEGQALSAGPGECVFFPKKRPHAFRIRSHALRMLVWVSPAWLDGYFRALSEPAGQLALPGNSMSYASTADMNRIHQVAEQHGIRFLSQDEISLWLPLFESDARAA